jgi:hypothetical protein
MGKHQGEGAKASMPKLECCGVIIERYKNLKSLDGFHGEYMVYKRL